jgi:hypothetical protein
MEGYENTGRWNFGEGHLQMRQPALAFWFLLPASFFSGQREAGIQKNRRLFNE